MVTTHNRAEEAAGRQGWSHDHALEPLTPGGRGACIANTYIHVCFSPKESDNLMPFSSHLTPPEGNGADRCE